MSGEIRFGTTLKKNKMALPKGLASLMYRSPEGHVAEWLRSGLQNRLPRFNSGRGLQENQSLSPSPSSNKVRIATGLPPDDFEISSRSHPSIWSAA